QNLGDIAGGPLPARLPPLASRRPPLAARLSPPASRRPPPAARLMLILDQSDVQRLLPMSECIEVMTSTLATLARGDAILPLRTVIRIPNGRDAFAVMPAYLGEPKTI